MIKTNAIAVRTAQSGFSLAEALVVLAIVTTMTSVSLYYFYAHGKLYKPDEQASHFIDVLQEARQRALTQKVTMRVELDVTSNVVRLINEKDPSVATDDVVVRAVQLTAVQEVSMDRRPTNVSTSPTETAPVPIIAFATSSVHPLSLGHKVATLRFKKDGSVTDAGTTAIGGGANTTGSTIFVWQPDKTNTNNSTITRAITVIGSSGAIRLWNYYPSKPTNSQWADSRRFQ